MDFRELRVCSDFEHVYIIVGDGQYYLTPEQSLELARTLIEHADVIMQAKFALAGLGKE